MEAERGKLSFIAQEFSGTAEAIHLQSAQVSSCHAARPKLFLRAERVDLKKENAILYRPALYLFGHRVFRLHRLTKNFGENRGGGGFPLPQFFFDSEDIFHLTFFTPYALQGVRGRAALLLTPKTVPLLALEEDPKKSGFSYFLGATRVKNKFFQNTTLAGAWLRYRLPPVPLFVEGGRLNEEVSRSRLFYFRAGSAFPLFSMGPFSLKMDSSIFAYRHRKPYAYVVPKFLLALPSLSLWFAPAAELRKPPFTVQELPASTEIGVDKKVVFRSVVLNGTVRYDSRNRRFQEIKGSWLKRYDCVEFGISYEVEGKAFSFLLSSHF